jgi:hypothetical protein
MMTTIEVKKLRRCEVEIYKLSFLTSQFLSFCARDEFLQVAMRIGGT